MGFRSRTILAAVASLLLVASCGGGGSNSTNSTSNASTPTVSLPLQPTGLAVGGDVQSRATDVLRRGITEEQARQIAEACADAAEIANASQDCLQTIMRVFEQSGLCGGVGFCLEAFDVSHVQGTKFDGYIEIVEDRPEKSLCGSGPGSLCLRVGVATSALLQRVVTSTLPSTSSRATTSTTTDTTSTSSSDTPSTTSDVTSATTASS